MKTSATQFELLVTFMEQHGDLSKPTSEPNGRIKNINNWQNLANLLNSEGSGDAKTIEKWKKVWSDFKNNTKKKAARIHRAAKATGGGPANFSRLTDLEIRTLNLIGTQAATGLAVEEAGLSQQRTISLPTQPPVAADLGIDHCSQPWNQPGPSYRPHIGPNTSPVPDIMAEIEIDIAGSHHSHNYCTPRVIASPSLGIEVEDTNEVTPTLHGSSEAVRCDDIIWPTATATRETAQTGQTTPRRSRLTRTRGSPRRRVRPAYTEQAAQHFLRSDEEWRKFKIQRHKDFMEIERQKNINRREEVEVQRGWQTIAARLMDNIDKIVNKYCNE